MIALIVGWLILAAPVLAFMIGARRHNLTPEGGYTKPRLCVVIASITLGACTTPPKPNVMKEAPGPVAAVCDPARPWECVKPVRPVSLAPATVPAKGQRARVFPK